MDSPSLPSSSSDRKLAVFDWNGTLFDDLLANVTAANQVMAMFGHPPLTPEQYQHNFTFPIIHSYVKAGISAETYLSRHHEAAAIFLENYEREALGCGLREGTVALLEALNAAGVHCMILSNHLRENVESQLARFHIRRFFAGVSCNEQYDASFVLKMNKQDRLGSYMLEGGFSPDRSVIVGDTLEEPGIARNLGLAGVCMAGGCVSEPRLQDFGPDRIAHSMAELGEYLRERGFL